MAVLSKPKIAIRPATFADDEFVLELATSSFHEYDPHARVTTARMRHESGAQTLLAVRGDAPLGFAIVGRIQAGTWAVNAIAVAPQERGRGVGQRLMRELEQRALRAGVSVLSLCTAQANLAALDLFLRLGFVIKNRHVVRYWGRQPACLLEKQLG